MNKIIFFMFNCLFLLQTMDAMESRDLFKAVKNGKVQEVEALIKAGFDVNAKDSGGWTPLSFAASNGFYDIAELLLNKGANVNVKDNNDCTPLQLARKKGKTEIVHLLQYWLTMLAFCEVQHPRLNVNSPAKVLNQHLLQEILQYLSVENSVENYVLFASSSQEIELPPAQFPSL